jgi:hypothetical protein
MKDEWSGSRQLAVEAVGNLIAPSAPSFLLCFHSSHIVVQSDGELVIAGNGPDYTSGPDIGSNGKEK